jgi:hypothetical protein
MDESSAPEVQGDAVGQGQNQVKAKPIKHNLNFSYTLTCDLGCEHEADVYVWMCGAEPGVGLMSDWADDIQVIIDDVDVTDKLSEKVIDRIADRACEVSRDRDYDPD